MTKQENIKITYKRTCSFDSLNMIKAKANGTDTLAEACRAWLESRVHTVAEALNCRKEPFNIRFKQAYGGWEVRVNVFGITYVAVGHTREAVVENFKYANIRQQWPVQIEYDKTTDLDSRAGVEYWANRSGTSEAELSEACKQWLKDNPKPLTVAEYLAHNPQAIAVKRSVHDQRWFAYIDESWVYYVAYDISPCAAMTALMKLEIKETK